MKAIMVQGTASDVGKSVICTALCRHFYEKGYRVAPFKSQNMALNSYVTKDGKEIGRAQGVQAEAAGIEATADMNPILLKPKGEMVSEVIVHGRHFADLNAMDYRKVTLEKMLGPVKESLDRLAQTHEILVIEGAGSPAEINLKDRDIANMRVAELTDAPVILVGDIERGGVFASLVGTLELLSPAERERVKGFVINKFRGNRELLEPGLRWLEERTGIPVLGVLPFADHRIDPEDSLALDRLRLKRPPVVLAEERLDIAVIRLPFLSNFTDFLPLSDLKEVQLRYVQSVSELGAPDCVILPGSKNTMDDLGWLKHSGMTQAIVRCHRQGAQVVGICGGYQMLGRKLFDPDCIESSVAEQDGLGLLEIETTFVPEKRTVRQKGKVLIDWANGVNVAGYEIHLGRTHLKGSAMPFLHKEDGFTDGAFAEDGNVWGTYFHGIFENRVFLEKWLSSLFMKKGWDRKRIQVNRDVEERESIYTGLVKWLRENLDTGRLEKIMGLS